MLVKYCKKREMYVADSEIMKRRRVKNFKVDPKIYSPEIFKIF